MSYASILKRFIAALIDGAFVMLIYFVVRIIPFFPFVLWPLIVLYYHVAFETSVLRATPGKIILNIALVRLDGEKISAKDSIVRFFASFISSILFGAGYLLALFSKKRQTFHDSIANTVVINGKFSDEGIWEVFLAQSKMYYKKLSKTFATLRSSK